MNDSIRQWWKYHEGWFAVGLLSIGVFGAGWTAGVVALRADVEKQVVRLQDSHRETLDAKDALIARLANTTAAAAEKSNAAVATVVAAADKLDAAADKADKAAGQTAKSLKGLK